ncbi:flagellar biosynthesis protein FlgL [Sphingomonas sp. Leaf357]|uniref:flagellar hook-associated protein FlgL n=1 Tax=Sphingomonas sp. Leaf357 TaxID=1736350 RepID=UPI0007016B9E|nr:flagellar hook-associated protein FlgL [Sphingomonas sp. Leaf357]KQS03354.1 flagellar biosynthesis protein FlgL [Sphingomonas sp. Leaf357]
MQISTSQLYDRSTTLMQQLTAKADKLQTQISTDKKISTASDDAVAYQKLASIKRSNANDTAYGANIKVVQSLLAQSDSTLGSVESQLQKAAELATQANNDTLNAADRKVIGDQLTAIVQDLVGLANTKDVRGQPLFGGSSGDTAVAQAADGSVSFTGTGEPSAIPVGDGVDVHATNSAQRVFGGISTSSGTSDVFAIISKLAAALTSNTDASAAAADAGNSLKTALTQIGAARGSVGARGARLDLETARLTDVAATREADRSSLEDTDTAAAITELQKTMTVLSATQASFTKLSSLSLFNYLN